MILSTTQVADSPLVSILQCPWLFLMGSTCCRRSIATLPMAAPLCHQGMSVLPVFASLARAASMLLQELSTPLCALALEARPRKDSHRTWVGSCHCGCTSPSARDQGQYLMIRQPWQAGSNVLVYELLLPMCEQLQHRRQVRLARLASQVVVMASLLWVR